MSMYPVLEDGTVGTVPIESEAGEHRGLLISVMERGTVGLRMWGEIDFDADEKIVRVGIPHDVFELWITMLIASVKLLTTMPPPVDPLIAGRAESEEVRGQKSEVSDEGGES